MLHREKVQLDVREHEVGAQHPQNAKHSRGTEAGETRAGSIMEMISMPVPKALTGQPVAPAFMRGLLGVAAFSVSSLLSPTIETQPNWKPPWLESQY